MTNGAQILIVDDEKPIRRFLRVGLESNGYRVHEAASGREALAEAAALRPDVIVLDLGLPDLDGLDVLKRLREWSRTPVVVLSVREAEQDKIAMLDAGADDYLTKPFGMGELLARLRVAQRHSQLHQDTPIFRNGHLTVDLAHRLVTMEEREVKLTATEYAMLRLFVQHAGKVLTHRQILREIWGASYIDQTHYLRVYMAQLRRKLEIDPGRPKLFLTEPGVGYRLAVLK